MPTPINVALLTHAGGAHVGAYLQALAASEDCGEVLLADPDGHWVESARKVLGGKLKAVHRDAKLMLAQEKPTMAMVTMEARIAPPVIDLALEAGCHVFAEKPACLRAEDFAPLAQKADSKHLHLMLALANRLNPELVAARKLIAEGAIGKIYGLEMHLVADQTRPPTRLIDHNGIRKRKGRAAGTSYGSASIGLTSRSSSPDRKSPRFPVSSPTSAVSQSTLRIPPRLPCVLTTARWEP